MPLLANSRPYCGVVLWLVRSADGGCHVLRERLQVLRRPKKAEVTRVVQERRAGLIARLLNAANKQGEKTEAEKPPVKGSRRRNSRLTCLRVSGDRCGDAVGFSLSERRRCKGRRRAERAGVTPRIARSISNVHPAHVRAVALSDVHAD